MSFCNYHFPNRSGELIWRRKKNFWSLERKYCKQQYMGELLHVVLIGVVIMIVEHIKELLNSASFAVELVDGTKIWFNEFVYTVYYSI